ncbi:MAG: MerR family transcriptional regulator [Gemmobacter sp.]|nr:MerR family transcriptional regulator [Gemmobacter sp.]
MEKSPDAFRTISEVADFLETPAHVLRFWETRFPQVRPVKRAGGRRYYRPSDVALLSGIRQLLHDQGMTIRGVQKILREQGVRHVCAIGAPGQAVDEIADWPDDNGMLSGDIEIEDRAVDAASDEDSVLVSDDPHPVAPVVVVPFGAVAVAVSADQDDPAETETDDDDVLDEAPPEAQGLASFRTDDPNDHADVVPVPPRESPLGPDKMNQEDLFFAPLSDASRPSSKPADPVISEASDDLLTDASTANDSDAPPTNAPAHSTDSRGLYPADPDFDDVVAESFLSAGPVTDQISDESPDASLDTPDEPLPEVRDTSAVKGSQHAPTPSAVIDASPPLEKAVSTLPARGDGDFSGPTRGMQLRGIGPVPLREHLEDLSAIKARLADLRARMAQATRSRKA